ncbi:MAG: hypothetical protein JSS72_07620 [Armatimonadetes bacterium]|nr:hypothetical protein [Armatimonadota bacterium]
MQPPQPELQHLPLSQLFLQSLLQEQSAQDLQSLQHCEQQGVQSAVQDGIWA